MGLKKYILNKVNEKKVNYQAERAHQKEEKLEVKNQYEKGYREGQYKRGVLEGSGGVTAQTKFAARGGKPQGVTGSGSFSGSMNKFDSIFGVSQIGGGRGSKGDGGMGLGLGFGGGGESRSRPDRVITKANGKVRIEEYGSKHESEDGFGSLGLGGGIGLEGFGGSSKKKEKHPYDLF